LIEDSAKGKTMLGLAACQDTNISIKACEKLLAMGANINALDGKEKAALFWAINNKDNKTEAKIAEFLLDNNARTDLPLRNPHSGNAISYLIFAEVSAKHKPAENAIRAAKKFEKTINARVISGMFTLFVNDALNRAGITDCIAKIVEQLDKKDGIRLSQVNWATYTATRRNPNLIVRNNPKAIENGRS
jgi:hypothetical protein